MLAIGRIGDILQRTDIVIPLFDEFAIQDFDATSAKTGFHGFEVGVDLVVVEFGVGKIDGDVDVVVGIRIDDTGGVAGVFLFDFGLGEGVVGFWNFELEFVIVEAKILSFDLLAIVGLDGHIGLAVLIEVAHERDDADND